MVAAARSEFASRGYETATMRSIARAAGVDARLVHHYFDSKEDLFVAAMELPIHPNDLIEKVLDGPRDRIGERLVRFFLGVWDSPEGRPVILALVRSAVSHDDAAQMLQQFVTGAILGRIASAVDTPDPQMRAALVASQMTGLVFVRHVLKIEPVASASLDELVPLLAPTVQRYLTAP